MNKFTVSVRTEYFDLDKEDVVEDVMETVHIAEAMQKVGKLVNEMMRDGMVIDWLGALHISLETKDYPEGDGMTKYIGIKYTGSPINFPLEYGFVCQSLTRENTLKVIESMSNQILRTSGHAEL